MTATEAAFTGLIDYAGLYPPAALDMRTAVRNYLGYREQKHAWMLGRFIVDVKRLDELRETAGDASTDMRLSVTAGEDPDLHAVAQHRRAGLRIEAIEIKGEVPLKIARICEDLPDRVECYVEIPLRASSSNAIDVIAAVGVNAKLRMGGAEPAAFPSAAEVAERLHLLADRRVAFKATAGLHHPVRSRHRLTYAPDSPVDTMHGFMNMVCAAAVTHFGGTAADAERLLEERDVKAFEIRPDSLAALGYRWTTAQLGEMRECFRGFGSCSFTEPIEDLEALGWL